jgi:hypothetical protein
MIHLQGGQAYVGLIEGIEEVGKSEHRNQPHGDLADHPVLLDLGQLDRRPDDGLVGLFVDHGPTSCASTAFCVAGADAHR